MRIKMKKLVYVLVASLCFVGASAHAEMKIAVVDTVRAILATEEAKVLIDAASKEVESERSSLQALAEKINSLTEKLQKDGEVMSDAERRSTQKEIEDARIDLDFNGKKLQKEAQDKQSEILQVLAPKYEKVLKDLIEVEGIDMIITPNALEYANSIHDITRRVTEKMNETKN